MPPSEPSGRLDPDTQYALEALEELRIRERLGEDVGELEGRVDLDEPHLLPLDHFMGEVLADVDVLGTLASADHVVSPLDARRVVLVHRGVGLGQQVAEVDDLDGHLGGGVVLGLGG